MKMDVLKKFLAISIVLIMSIGIVSCGPKAPVDNPIIVDDTSQTEEDNSSNTEEKIIRMDLSDVGYPSVYTVSKKGQGYVALQFIFDTLVWKDSTGEIPYLAEKYEVSEDNKTYTFFLRKGVKFTDGEEFNAEDVKFTFDYTKEHPYHYASTSMIKETRIIDDYTVEIELSDVYVPFISDVAGCLPILPEHIWKDITEPETFTDPEAVITTGAFKLESYDSASGVYVFTKNENFFYGKVLADKLIVSNYDDAREAFVAGDLDVSATMGYKKATSFKSDDKYKVLEGPGLWVSRLYFNFNEPAFSSKEVRQAMHHALNLDEIVEKVKSGAAIAGSAGHIQPDTPWYNPNIQQYPYDVEKAKALLVEAGAVDSNNDGVMEFEGKEMKFEALFGEKDVQYAELVVNYLKEIGIELEVKTSDDNTVKTLIGEGNFTLAVNGHGSFGGDPVLLGRFASDSDGAPKVTAQGGKVWHNEEYNKIFAQSAMELDKEKRHELVNKLQEIIAEELPTITMFYNLNATVYNPAVYDGYYYTPDGIGIAIPFAYNKLCFVE
ncbi:MAG: ABC transporter substrate-binding protein [Tissierellales bacterium]